MNSNFADWEITQLLPKHNTYTYKLYHNVIDDKNNVYSVDKGGYPYEPFKDVWTWEDIRLYLLDKGYYITHQYLDDFDFKYGQFLVYKDIDPKIKLLKSFEGLVYEEIRKKAIIYCLNQIKEDENIDRN